MNEPVRSDLKRDK